MRGFTLLEVVIYIALLSIVMGGTLAATFQLLEGQSKASGHDTTEEEGSFVLQKLSWMMGQASTSDAISSPASGVVRILEGDGTHVEMCFPDGFIRLSTTTCSASSEALTTANVKVTAFDIKVLPAAGGAPEGLAATSTIDGVDFAITRYLRQ